ncbi:DgyrCDS3579 [Dimorphilus gyrociliatus]|uniref:DgyrCDS3579 n=1 Tax=Dimorphilus gyrociliatus TaxID=2664684 RepID=A0A7I8VFJ0_9ANNE|nr:DgyrCDS3579 [Dimorphilus gyrociliatus]
MACDLAKDTFWFDKARTSDAERIYFEKLYGNKQTQQKNASASSVVDQIARAREQIEKSLSQTNDSFGDMASEAMKKLELMETSNKNMIQKIENLTSLVSKLQDRVKVLEGKSSEKPKEEEEDDDDEDLFASDDEEEDEEASRIREERLKAYAEKKSAKKAVVAKSSLILEVKPWDDETDMKALEESVRTVTMDGLLWGASKLVPVGYGIQKLQISCVIEDDKVSTDDLTEKIEAFEDYVQSVDIAAFNKI